MIIEDAQPADAEEILALQKLAYQSEARIYDDYSIPPLTQTLEQMRDDFDRQRVLKASIADRIIGSVRAYRHEGTCFIGRLIVHPDFQKKGIGTGLMQAIEGGFPEAKRFELFTGHLSEGNIRLYRRLGYEAFREQPVTDRLSLVFMEKISPG
ncbi:GNAT family N-acetyltransferase [Thermodesulfobacteriota bacterium]